MIALRCTRKALQWLGSPLESRAPSSATNALGDWYINLLPTRRQHVVMATSELSLLTVLMPAREARRSLLPMLRATLQELLLVLGVSPESVAAELAEMGDAQFASTASRTVLGSMNEFRRMLAIHVDDDPLMHAMLRFAAMPMSGIGGDDGLYGCPGEMARRLLTWRTDAIDTLARLARA